jgi:hypothetical protein
MPMSVQTVDDEMRYCLPTTGVYRPAAAVRVHHLILSSV